MKSAVIKRSVVVNGRKTSVSLENEFWDALRQVAKQSNLSVASLLGEIERSRTTINLSSAIRIFLLNHFRKGNSDQQSVSRGPWFLINEGGVDPKRQTTRLAQESMSGTMVSSRVERRAK
jgi:predicted DNA-binding ribbon-helix-helix protein